MPPSGSRWAGRPLVERREERRQRWQDFLWYALPFVVVYLPYFVWRWRYYGDLFPNTYYAKSADLPYFQQGGIYVLSTVVIGGLWALSPLVAAGGLAHAAVGGDQVPGGGCAAVSRLRGEDRRGFHAGAAADPVLLLGFLFADVGFRELLARRRWLLTGSLVALAAVAAVPARTIRPLEKVWNLADESTFYRLGKFNPPRWRSSTPSRLPP